MAEGEIPQRIVPKSPNQQKPLQLPRQSPDVKLPSSSTENVTPKTSESLKTQINEIHNQLKAEERTTSLPTEEASSIVKLSEQPIGEKEIELTDFDKQMQLRAHVEKVLREKFQSLPEKEEKEKIARTRQEAENEAMITVKTKFIIRDRTPEDLFLDLLTLDEPTYIAMAPKNHKKFQIKAQEDGIIGSTFRFVEEVRGLKIDKTMRVYSLSDTPEEKHIAQRSLDKVVPVELQQTLKKVDGGTEMSWELHIGRKFGGLEKLIKWAAQHSLFTPEQENAQKVHAEEEFQALAGIWNEREKQTATVLPQESK